MMIQRLLQFLFDETPASFPSRHSLAESAERLRARITCKGISLRPREGLAGSVRKLKVSLCRVRKYAHNDFRPVFKGVFVEKDGRVVLEGKFTRALAVRIFALCWLSFGLALTLGVAIIPSKSDSAPPNAFALLFCFFVITGGAVIFRSCICWARADIHYISEAIGHALGSHSVAVDPLR